MLACHYSRKKVLALSLVTLLFMPLFIGIQPMATGDVEYMTSSRDIPRPAVSDADTDGDGLADTIETNILGTSPTDWQDPGPHIVYDTVFMTRDYACWQTFSNSTDNITLATADVVIRRGTDFELWVPSGSNVTMDDGGRANPPEMSGAFPRNVSVSADASVGIYTFTVTKGAWSAELRVFVVFDPWASGISDDMLGVYAYNESSHNDEKDVIWPVLPSPRVCQLYPFSGPFGGNPTVYELAMELINGSVDDTEAVMKIYRLSSQRNEANLTYSTNFAYQNISRILFMENGTVEPLTLDDAAAVGNNGVSLDARSSGPTKTKKINGWCMEATMTVVGLCRAVGIPARAITMYSLEGIMGHYIPEVWLSDPPMLRDANLTVIPDQNWYIFDADEWCYPVDFWTPPDPIRYSHTGNVIAPRYMYSPMMDVLFKGYYHFDGFYCVGLDWDLNSPVNLRNIYRSGQQFRITQGKQTFPVGHGLGLFLYLDGEEIGTEVRLEVDAGIEAYLMMNRTSNPGNDLFFSGWPFPLDPENLTVNNSFTIQDGGKYYISIFPRHDYSEANKGNNGFVTIHVGDTSAPRITHQPASQIGLNEDILITANITDDEGVSAVRLNYTDITGQYHNLTMIGAGDSWMKVIPGQPAPYLMNYSIWANDTSGNQASQFFSVNVTDLMSPSIVHSQVFQWPVMETLSVTAAISDDLAVGSVFLNYTDVHGVSHTVNMTEMPDNWYVSIPGQNATGNISYTITATDTYNNTNASGPFLVSIYDDVKPEIIHTSPGPKNMTDAFTIRANVSDNLGVGVVTLLYTGSDGVYHSVTMAAGTSGYEYSVPAQSVAGTFTYIIAASDTGGNTNSTDYLYIDILDNVPPVVKSNSPVGSGVNVSTEIMITFDEAMNTTYSGDWLSFIPPVNFTVSLNDAGTQLIVMPDDPLNFSTAYTVTVGGDACDAAGNHLATPFSWVFTTEDAPPADNGGDVMPPELPERNYPMAFLLNVVALLALIGVYSRLGK